MVHTVIATQNDVDKILRCTNDAFMADAYFKQPRFDHRFTREEVISKITQNDSVFILAYDSKTIKSLSDEVTGSVFLHWITKTEKVVTNIDSIIKVTLVGKLSAVSVPLKYSKRGIGKALVASAENYIRENVFKEIHQTLCSDNSNNNLQFDIVMEIDVINLQVNLRPWYERQGYKITGEIVPFVHDEFTFKILDDVDVYFILMRKTLM